MESNTPEKDSFHILLHYISLTLLTLRGPQPGVRRCCRRREVHRGKGEGEGGRRGAAAVSRCGGGGPVGGVGREEAHTAAQGGTASTATKYTILAYFDMISKLCQIDTALS